MPSLDRNATVAQIVTENAAAARVFQKYGIDYCCRGGVSVPEACGDRGLDPGALFAELEAALPGADGASTEDPRTLSTAGLVARIVDRHHGYLRRTLPHVEALSAKVAKVHGAKDPRLVEVDASFRALAASLLPHLEEEETVLFPAMMSSRGGGDSALRTELARMHADHLAVGDLLARLRSLTDGYAVPAWGCTTYRVLMSELEAVEADTLRHVHLENHVLAPRFGGVDA